MFRKRTASDAGQKFKLTERQGGGLCVAVAVIPRQIAKQEDKIRSLWGFSFDLGIKFLGSNKIGGGEPMIALKLIDGDARRQNITRYS